MMILLLLQDEGYRYYFGTVQPEKFSPTIQVVAENGRAIVESQVGLLLCEIIIK